MGRKKISYKLKKINIFYGNENVIIEYNSKEEITCSKDELIDKIKRIKQIKQELDNKINDPFSNDELSFNNDEDDFFLFNDDYNDFDWFSKNMILNKKIFCFYQYTLLFYNKFFLNSNLIIKSKNNYNNLFIFKGYKSSKDIFIPNKL